MRYQLSEDVELLRLKYGEILLINKKTGYWVKTSISFFPIYRLLKKGIEKHELYDHLEDEFKDRTNDIKRVIELIKNNGLLQFHDFKVDLTELKNSNFANIITRYPIDEKFLCFLKNFSQRDKLYVIFENNIIDLRNSFKELEEIKKEINLYSIFRIDYLLLNAEIIEVLTNSPFNEVQLTLKKFFIEESKEKLRLIESLKNRKKLNLRINLVQYSSLKGKESVVLPVDVIEPHSYTFTFEDILESKDKIYNKIKKFFKLWEIFHTEIRIPKKSIIKPQVDNLFSFMVIFPIKRDSCGAGHINFFINEQGDIYPCKYMTNFKIGNLTDCVKEQRILSRQICRECVFLNFCGGIGQCIPERDFEKICKFIRNFFKKAIESFSVDLLKRLEEYYTDRQRETIPEEEVADTRIRLIKRFTCLPGIY